MVESGVWCMVYESGVEGGSGECDRTHNDDVEVLGEVVGQRAPRHLLLAHPVEPVVLLALLHGPRHQRALHAALHLYLHSAYVTLPIFINNTFFSHLLQ